jgi:hypothetical protein
LFQKDNKLKSPETPSLSERRKKRAAGKIASLEVSLHTEIEVRPPVPTFLQEQVSSHDRPPLHRNAHDPVIPFAASPHVICWLPHTAIVA